MTKGLYLTPVERLNDISFEDLRHHAESLRPVIFRENEQHWPPMRWTPEDLMARHGTAVVRVLDADIQYEGRSEEEQSLAMEEIAQPDLGAVDLERLIHRVIPPYIAPRVEPVLFPLVGAVKKQLERASTPEKTQPLSATTYAKQGDAHRLADFLNLILTKPTRARIFLGDIASFIPDAGEGLKSIGFIHKYGYEQSALRPGRLNWFAGGQGASTPLHHDEDFSSSFLCQLFGRKRVILFPYEQTSKLYRAPFSVASPVDPTRPDFHRYPKLKEATAFEAVLEPGDTLHIPGGWWHYVQYIEPGYSLGNRFYVRSAKVPLTRHYPRALEWRFSAYRFRTYFINYPVDMYMEGKLGRERWRRWKGARVGDPDLFMLLKEHVHLERRRAPLGARSQLVNA
jgi:hypothetical protein